VKPRTKAAAAAQFEERTKVKIKVPEGVAAGDEITVTPPNGKEVKVMVPEGVVAGQEIEVELSIDVGMGTNRRGKLPYLRLLLKWTDGCGVQYVQREAALGTASLYGDIEVLAEQATDPMAKLGVIGIHNIFPPHCFKYIHDAAGKVFSDNKDKGVKQRSWTISNIEQHYDYNAATMLTPKNANFNFDFSFHNYIHLLYKEESFINLEADAVPGIKSWRVTEGGTDARATGRAGAGGGAGFGFRSQPQACYCGGKPCKHHEFTGEPKQHRVYACKQEKADRELTTNFIDSIDEGTALASVGDLKDSTSGNEPIWLSLAKGKVEVNKEPFIAAGGAGSSGVRTIARNWKYVDIQWLVKVRSLPLASARARTLLAFCERTLTKHAFARLGSRATGEDGFQRRRPLRGVEAAPRRAHAAGQRRARRGRAGRQAARRADEAEDPPGRD
jgi:hypothetical protein